VSEIADTPANASSRQLVLNFATGYLGLVVSILLSLVLTPVILHRLGTQDYGLWVVIVAIGGYVGVIGAGVETAAVQQIAAAIAVGNTDRLREIIATSRAFFVGSGFLAGLVVAGLVPFVGDTFHVDPGLLASARISILLMAVITGLTMMTNIPLTVLFGGGRSDKSAIFSLILAVASQGALVATVLLGGGFTGIFVVGAAQALIGFFALNVITKRSGLLPVRRGRATRAMMKELLRSGRRNVTVALGGTIAYSLDAVVIGLILPVARVTPYDLALSTANFTRNISTAATNLLMPSYAHSAALDDRERQFRLWSRAVLFSMAITVPIVIALLSFGEALLRLWIGTVPPGTYSILVALNVVILIQLPGHQSFIFLTGVGKNAILARLSIGPSLVNLGLSIGATYWLGPIGPAIGSLPQVIVLDFIVLPILCCRTLDVGVRRYLRKALAPIAIPALAASAAAAILLWTVGNRSSVLALVESVAVCLFAWAAFAVFLYAREPTIRRFISWKGLMRRTKGSVTSPE
jgi:O-antigen/teichoic acid export membrane protein